MKRTLFAPILLVTVASFACTKQKSQQPQVNSTTTDARHDISNQPGTIATPQNEGQEPITTNPNSARAGDQSTLNTSQGAAVVGDSNLNPRAEGAAGRTPTSVNTDKSPEPKTDAAIQKSNCLDGKVGSDCPPTAQSPMRSSDTSKDAPKK